MKKIKKLALIATISAVMAVLAMPLTALAAGAVSVTYQSSPSANAAVTPDGDDATPGFETTPENAYADGGGSAVDTDSGDIANSVAVSIGTDKHDYYNYGFDVIPDGSTILGITVRADIAVNNIKDTPYTAIRLSYNGGTDWTTIISQDLSQIAELTYTYGGPANDWGHTPWLASELTDANFRVQVINGDAKDVLSPYDFSLDWIPVSITYTAPWDSYEDTGRNTGRDTFTASYYIVYMEGTGFLDGTQTYNVGYYDAGGTLIITDNNIALVSANGRGTLGDTSTPYKPTYDLTSDLTAQGSPPDWHAVAQPSGATAFPPSYSTLSGDPDTYELIADDTFTVAPSAIPEFPTIIAGLVVAGTCFGIYWWMRKRVYRVHGVR